jgi:subtilisin family serine protease
MAAAHASGAAALVLQKEPSLSSAKVKQRLLDNARSDVISLGQIRGASVPNKLLFVP